MEGGGAWYSLSIPRPSAAKNSYRSSYTLYPARVIWVQYSSSSSPSLVKAGSCWSRLIKVPTHIEPLGLLHILAFPSNIKSDTLLHFSRLVSSAAISVLGSYASEEDLLFATWSGWLRVQLEGPSSTCAGCLDVWLPELGELSR